MDEIETILDSADVELINQTPRFSKYKLGHAQIQVENGSDTDGLLDAIRSLQQSLPDDLEARREAAAKNITEFHDEIDPSCPGSVLRYIAEYHHGLTDGSLAAFKRVLGIHTGDFSAESEYFQTEPEYPEQWLQHMSEESAEWLYKWLDYHKSCPFDWYRYPEFNPSPIQISQNSEGLGVVMHKYDKQGNLKAIRAMPIAFSGALELPDFIDEEEL